MAQLLLGVAVILMMIPVCVVPSPNTDFMAIAAGWHHSLGLKRSGAIVAWGCAEDNNHGQCDVPAPNSDFLAIAAGGAHSLGLKTDGSVIGWGLSETVIPPSDTSFVAIAAGGTHSLAIRLVSDCNGNSQLDSLDICEGSSFDEDLDGVPDECQITASLDMMPKKCPNRVKTRGRGVVRAALAGSDSFDVRQVDVQTLELRRADGVGASVQPLFPKQSRNRGSSRQSIPPSPCPLPGGEGCGSVGSRDRVGSSMHSHADASKLRFRDVATFDSNDSCECGEDGSDGFDDLILKFDAQELIDAFELESESPGTSIAVTIRGAMLDGTIFEASDCIVQRE